MSNLEIQPEIQRDSTTCIRMQQQQTVAPQQQQTMMMHQPQPQTVVITQRPVPIEDKFVPSAKSQMIV